MVQKLRDGEFSHKPKMKKKIIWMIITLLMTRINSSVGVNENGHKNMDVDNKYHDPVSDDVRAMGGPKKFENILNDKFIVINGFRTSLSALFGNKRPTASSLRVGEKIKRAFDHKNLQHEDVIISPQPLKIEEHCATGSYTPRMFSEQPTKGDTWAIPLIEDGPTGMAEAVLRYTTCDYCSVEPAIIVGGARSGKSVALARIQTLLSEVMPTLWTIRINLSGDRYSGLSLEDMVKRAVGSDFSDLMSSVMETSPRRIVLLIDGTDHLTDRRVEEVVSITTSAINKGILTILTGRQNILNFFTNVRMQLLTIKEMTFQATEHFLTNAWRSAVEHELSSPHLIPPNPAEVQERLTYFARALTHTLFKTSLPRQPVTLEILADLFESRNSITDYVFYPSTESPSLVAGLENLPLDVNMVYEKMASALTRGNSLDFSKEYEILAVKAIKQRDEFAGRPLLPLPRDFKRSVTKALGTLRPRQAIDPIINIDAENKVTFCYPGIEDYYAAKYVLRHFDDSNVQALVKHFFKDNYYSVLEVLNAESFPRLQAFYNRLYERETSLQTMENIIRYGYDKLFDYVYENLHLRLKNNEVFNEMLRRKLVDKALANDKHIPQKVFGMAQVSLIHPNPYAETAQAEVIPTLLHLIIKHNMQKTLTTMLNVFENQRQRVKKDLLDAAVTRSVPNLQIVKDLMDFFPPKALQADLDRLLYETVDKVGDGCQPVARYLVERGAQPTNAIVEGSTLVHAAVKSNSANLLSFVVEDLLNVQGNIEDSRDAAGRSIFETALDANASPMYTFPGWWEMMDYLVEHLNPLVVTTRPVENLREKIIPRQPIKSSEYQLVLMNKDHHEFGNDLHPGESPFLKPLEKHGDSDKLIQLRSRFIPRTRWSFTENILSLRRLSWLLRFKNSGISQISPLEMLVYFRGAVTLQPAQHVHYQNAVLTLIRRYRDSLDFATKARIYRGIWKTVGDTRDLINAFHHTTILGPEISFTGSQYNQMMEEIMRWYLHMLHPGYPTVILPIRLMQTRLDYVQGQVGTNFDVIAMVDRFEQYITNLNREGGEDYLNLLGCLGQRTRRSHQAGCSISWNDVDKFNDVKQTRAVEKIQVNSDKFLQVLAETETSDTIKAYELVRLVRALQVKYNYEGLITGSSKMLVQDVLEEGGLSAYRQHRRITDLTGELWHSSARSRKYMALLPSRTTALYVGSHIPIVHALFSTIDVCLKHRVDPSDMRCWYSTGMLGLSVLLGPVGNAAVRYTPRMVDQFSRVALELLPAKAPAFLRENIYIVRNIGLKYGARALAAGLVIVGIGFDIYNIVTMSQAIAECNREPDMCTSRDKVEYIISLTFSCVSIVVTGGLMLTGVGIIPAIIIQLQLLVLENFAKGVNDAVYYATKYHTTLGETFRVFWRKFLGMSPPSDVDTLVKYKELIKRHQNHVIRVLNAASKDIIAYAIGIGRPTGKNIVASHGIIDMSRESDNNTRNLSRVIPKKDKYSVRLCLPREGSSKGYNDYNNGKSVRDAEYRCVNSFVLGHRKRWRHRNISTSYIVYDLRYIVEGEVIGSGTANNLFLIYNGTSSMNVMGGHENVTNNYIIHESSFRGNILLSSRWSKNIINLAGIENLRSRPIIEWHPAHGNGTVYFSNKTADSFHLIQHMKKISVPSLHFIGRAEKPEIYNCHYSEQHIDDDQNVISIDGNGGNSSLLGMDKITDCKVSIVRPFTHLVGSDSPNVTHRAYINLENATSKHTSERHDKYRLTKAPVIIEPQQSKYAIIFQNQSLLANVQSATYNTSSRTITWLISYSKSRSLELQIRNYSSLNESEINCSFIDNKLQAVIHPVIRRPSNRDNTTDTFFIRTFHVFMATNTSSSSDVNSRYQKLPEFRKSRFTVVTKFTHLPTGKTFLFGSKKSEHFYIDANTTFLQGRNGHDVYVLGQQAPRYVQIDNRAADCALDTLLILNSTCSSLFVQRQSLVSYEDYLNPHDVPLFCANDTKTSEVTVIIKNYLNGPANRHLKVIWNEAVYILLPLHWTQGNNSNSASGRDVKLGLVYSFSANPDALTLTSQNTRYLVLNTTEKRDSLLAYRLPKSNNALISQKSKHHPNTSFIILENFFSAGTNHTAVSAEWWQLKIFLTADVDDNQINQKILTAEDVLDLIFLTKIDDAFDAAINGDSIAEYLVNIAPNVSSTTIIEHNNGTDTHDRLGVLVVIGADPGNFHAKWSTNDSSSLSLCTQESRIVVRNWCLSPRRRLYRLEFFSAVDQRPTVIRDLDELDCQPNSLEKLNGKLQEAQKELNLTLNHDESDRARLIRCVVSVFVTSLPFNVTYKFLEFQSTIDYVSFIRSNCPSLFTKANLNQLSLKIVRNSLVTAAQKYRLNSLNSQEQQSIAKLQEFLDRVDDSCWGNFTQALNQLYKNNQTDILPRLNTTFEKINQISSILKNCVPSYEHD